MAAIEDLIRQIADARLRDQLATEVAKLKNQKKFGLVFEDHLPELLRLPKAAAAVGTRVVRKDDKNSVTYRVTAEVNKKWIKAVPESGGPEAKLDRSAVVVVKAFGEPIYPALIPIDAIERAPGKPWHVLINADNYHALQLLLYGYEGKVDVIYIDPPYNTGARDWKYNNDYVDDSDQFRHSKWLSMMKKRLLLAKRLLNPDRSTLIVTIDEKEYARLGLLLEDPELFPNARIQMVSTNVNPAAASRAGAFGRSDEYIYFVMLGTSPARLPLGRDWVSSRGRTHTGSPRWDLLRRSGAGARRDDSPGCFYPIYIDVDRARITGVGEPLPKGTSQPPLKLGSIPVLPIRKDRSEGRWMMGPDELRARIEQGRVRVSIARKKKSPVLYYLADGEYAKIQAGEFVPSGHGSDGSMLFDGGDSDDEGSGTVLAVPSTQWRIASHDSTQYGSRFLATMIPGRQFPYPKSIYAVEDALRFFVSHKTDAIVLDFFAGSGTTAHAVMRLNRQDGGTRRAILVSNNEVGIDNEAELPKRGIEPGSREWEAYGIFENVTRPRVRAAVTGRTPENDEIEGEYKFVDPFLVAEGFRENVASFKLDFLEPAEVNRGDKFESIVPILWMLAGCQGAPEVSRGSAKWFIPKASPFAVLLKEDEFVGFLKAIDTREGIDVVFLVTDSADHFHRMSRKLGRRYRCIQLYRSYIDTFRINLSEPGTISTNGTPVQPLSATSGGSEP